MVIDEALVMALNKASKAVRIARLDFEYSESVFRVREKIALWRALRGLRSVVDRIDAARAAGGE